MVNLSIGTGLREVSVLQFPTMPSTTDRVTVGFRFEHRVFGLTMASATTACRNNKLSLPTVQPSLTLSPPINGSPLNFAFSSPARKLSVTHRPPVEFLHIREPIEYVECQQKKFITFQWHGS
jgi:hypothetical protein